MHVQQDERFSSTQPATQEFAFWGTSFPPVPVF